MLKLPVSLMVRLSYAFVLEHMAWLFYITMFYSLLGILSFITLNTLFIYFTGQQYTPIILFRTFTLEGIIGSLLLFSALSITWMHFLLRGEKRLSILAAFRFRTIKMFVFLFLILFAITMLWLMFNYLTEQLGLALYRYYKVPPPGLLSANFALKALSVFIPVYLIGRIYAWYAPGLAVCSLGGNIENGFASTWGVGKHILSAILRLNLIPALALILIATFPVSARTNAPESGSILTLIDTFYNLAPFYLSLIFTSTLVVVTSNALAHQRDMDVIKFLFSLRALPGPARREGKDSFTGKAFGD